MGFMVIFSHLKGISNVALLMSLIVHNHIKDIEHDYDFVLYVFGKLEGIILKHG